MGLKLRTEISIEIEAGDFIEAAEHQRKLQVFMNSLRGDYPAAEMVIRERRGPRLKPVRRSERLRRTPSVAPYKDLPSAAT
ncbi:MAG TPA: hypothetical protein VGC92_15440 [Phenylobacterium sp.]